MMCVLVMWLCWVVWCFRFCSCGSCVGSLMYVLIICGWWCLCSIVVGLVGIIVCCRKVGWWWVMCWCCMSVVICSGCC